MADKTLNIVLNIDGKEAKATIEQTDQLVKELYKSFKYGQADVNGATIAMSRGFNNAREMLQGVRESFDALRGILAEPIKMALEDEVLRSNFVGTAEDLELFRKAVAGTVTDGGLIKMSNQATDLGLSMQQQAMLLSLAENAADKYGGSVEDNFTKIIAASEGSIKGLKNIGIQKEVYENTLKELAKAQGDELENLDAEMQKQLRLQAIIKASGITMADVTGKQRDNADEMERLNVMYTELRIMAGRAMAEGLSPFVKGLGAVMEGLTQTSPRLGAFVAVSIHAGLALGVLKTTGLMPAVFSMSAFRDSIGKGTGALKSFSSGITSLGVGLALFSAIVYGIGKVSDAAEHAADRMRGFVEAYKTWIDANKALIEGMDAGQAEWTKKYHEERINSKRAEWDKSDAWIKANRYRNGADAEGSNITILSPEVDAWLAEYKSKKEGLQRLWMDIQTSRAAVKDAEARLLELERQKGEKGTIGRQIKDTEAEIAALEAAKLRLTEGDIKGSKAIDAKIANLQKTIEIYKRVDIHHFASQPKPETEAAKIAAELNVMKQKDERERELEEIYNWYLKEEEIIKDDGDAKINLYDLYMLKRVAINKKYDEKELKDAEEKAKKEKDAAEDLAKAKADILKQAREYMGEEMDNELEDLEAWYRDAMKVFGTDPEMNRKIQSAYLMQRTKIRTRKSEKGDTKTFTNILGEEKDLTVGAYAANEAFSILGDSIREGMGDALRIFNEANSVLQIFINKLAEAAGQLLIMQTVKGLFSFATGGGFLAGFTALASGGIVTRPTIGLIGEAGPEAVIPLKSYMTGGYGGSRKIEIEMTPVVFRQSGTEMEATIELAKYQRAKRQ